MKGVICGGEKGNYRRPGPAAELVALSEEGIPQGLKRVLKKSD
jgi:hypothetical protein